MFDIDEDLQETLRKLRADSELDIKEDISSLNIECFLYFISGISCYALLRWFGLEAIASASLSVLLAVSLFFRLFIIRLSAFYNHNLLCHSKLLAALLNNISLTDKGSETT